MVVVCCLLFVVCCLLLFVWCVLVCCCVGVCCVVMYFLMCLLGVLLTWHLVGCLLSLIVIIWYSLRVVRCLLFVVGLSFLVPCVLFGVVRWLSFVVRWIR